MARQTIELGVIPDGAGGDTDRQAHDKSNSNATELYLFLGDGTNLVAETARQNIGALGEDDVYSMPEIDNFLSKKADLVSGLVPSSQLPSYVDDVIESDDFASLPATGEQGKIYVTIDNNKIYRWSGSAYIEIVGGAGGVADSALKLQTARNINGVPFDGTQDITIPKANIGLGNVDNTSDLNKPVSTATQTALNAKADLEPVKRGIGNTYDSSLSYNINDRVLLDDGTEVISTIANNTNDPNVDMTGWVATSFISLNSISELSANTTSATAYVKDVDSFYVYDESNLTPLSINGWVLQHNGTVSADQLNITDGTDITALLSYAVTNKLFIELPADHKFTTTTFTKDTQSVLVGNGSVQYVYDYLSNDNTENVAPKIANPYPPKGYGNNYGWYDSVEARGNFEHGAGYGLIVNDKTRPQVCGFRTKQQQKDYPSVDMVGLYTHVASPESVFLSNCTFTSNSVYSADLTASMDIKVGDFIRTASDPAIGMPWRSEITSINFETKTLGVTWWLHESGNGEGTPPNGLTCEAPYTNGLWGHNTNVFLYNGRSADRIIGYELGVYSEKTRDNFTSIDGYYVVNLTSQTARAQHAFKTGGTWDKGFGAYNCIDGVYTDGTTKIGLNFAPTADADSSAIRYDLNTRKTGNIVEAVAGVNTLFSIDALGVVSHARQDYKVSSVSDTHTALSPTLVLGANATAAHTTTINTTDMPAKTLLTFKQLDAVNWTIVAGSSSFILNTSGAMDYLQLFYDGSGFLKLFAGKSL